MTLIVDLYFKVNRSSPDNTQNYYSLSGLFSHRNPVIMRGVKEFLQSSTIHGLAYMATTDHKLTKLLWMFVVLSGFTAAAMLIQKAYAGWWENPISTNVDYRPITDLTFPWSPSVLRGTPSPASTSL